MTPLPAGKPLARLTVAVLLGASCAWLVDLAFLRGGTPHPLDDTWEYGLVARSLLAGDGFRTSLIHPPLWGMRDDAGTVPALVHGPLLPLLGAPLLSVFGRLFGSAALDGAAWLAAAFAIGAAVFTARAVARLAGSFAGLVAAVLVTWSPLMIRMVHHDIAPAAGACCVALLLDLLTQPEPPAFVTGLVAGAGLLVRPELALATPFAAYALGASRWLRFALGALLVGLPWGWHVFSATGSPVFSLSSYLLIAYTPAHPGLSPLWDFAIPPSRWPAVLAQSLPSLPAKWAHLAPRAIKHALMSPAPGLGAIAAVGLFGAAQSPRTRRLARAALGAAMIPLLMVTLTESSERYVAVFLPLWVIGVIQSAELLAGGRLRKGLARLTLLAVLLPFGFATMSSEARQAAALRDWLASERAALSSRGSAALHERLLFSDTPDFAGWTTGRPVLATTLESYGALRTAPGVTLALPPRGAPLDEWFHADVRALPAPSHGGTAVEAAGSRAASEVK